MKTTPRQLFLGTVVACFSALTLAALAQTTPPPAPPEKPAAADPVSAPQVSAPATPSASTSPSTSASDTPTVTATPSAASAEPAGPAVTAYGSTEAAASTSTGSAPGTSGSSTPSTSEASDASLRHIDQPAKQEAGSQPVHHRSGGQPRVAVFQNADLAKDESAESVVAVFGNATSAGDVDDSVVAVMGNAHVTGTVRNDVVAVVGNVYVDTKARDVVAVLGNVELGPNADVRDVSVVGGQLKRDPKAIIRGNTPAIAFPFFGTGEHAGLHSYLTNCVFKVRPLAFAPDLGWAWVIAFGFLFLYVALAALFRGGVEASISTLETRPGGSLLAALLTVLLTPVLFILLIITVVGLAVVPFLAIALAIAGLFGRVVVLAWLGRRITRLFGDGPLNHPAFGVLLGGVIVMLLYLIPVVGFITYKLIGFVGLGVVVYSLLLSSKRSRAARVAASPSAASAGAAEYAGSGFVATAGAATATEPVVAPPAVPLAALPRAGFWIRLAALLIDLILVSVVLVFLHLGAGFFFVLAGYGAVMWKTKGSTIGGIICGLRVVRVDGRPVDWTTACVRALSCFVSLVVIGLGFIWVAIDDEKQSWHDKIAGTTVVFSRGGNSLV